MENLALKQLGQLVYDYCGLNYLANLDSLEMKIQKRLSVLHMGSIWSYIRYLERTSNEWDPLMELLTINETYFYREDKQLEVFQKNILLKLTSTSADSEIKVWSAACSTGEEPYSLAILAKEKNQQHQLKITATDINKKVLTIAEEGKYNKRSLSFRRIPTQWLEKYFIQTTDTFELQPDIKQLVSFEYLNLLGKDIHNIVGEYDVIFCRNVLIYFDEETVKKVIICFYNALKKGGYLFLGHAETIYKLDIGFETINDNGTFYYRKG